MFKNIGKKIKGFATLLSGIGIVLSIIAGIIFFVLAGEASGDMDFLFMLLGGLTIIFGVIISWISSFAIYGFGELVDTNSQINDKLTKVLEGNKTETKNNIED